MNYLSTISHLCLDFLFPPLCVVCEKPLFQHTSSICPSCQNKFEPTNLGNWIHKVRNKEGLTKAYSGWYFSHTIQTVIHSLKYQERAKLGLELGRMLANLLPIEDVGPMDMLTVVPLHTVKNRERGYNQAQWIGKALAKTWSVPFNPKLLQRIRYTESQTTLNSEERKENMANAFRVRKNVDQKAIGIVDDVLTTGSTLSACAQALRRGGAREVIAITCATPKPKIDKTAC